ncbi:MAG: GIY-YIG nuclease family protein [Candidatus Magasanikbacteria bacterium]|nr:GIY-YIG nuclease family protein [Candidatus Magasanikbacteria bacterium]
MGKVGVYILSCSNGRYYIGSTSNLDRRLLEHKTGRVLSTKNILPVRLVFPQKFASIRTARTIEYRLKQKKSRTIIDKIIRDGYIRLV